MYAVGVKSSTMRLIGSELALHEVLALSSAGELTLSQLARAIGASPSAAQRALEILLGDGVVERSGDTRPLYRLRLHAVATHVLGLATGVVPLQQAVTIGARANPAIEYAAREGTVLTVVFSARSTALTQSRAARFVEALAAIHGLEPRYLDHDDVRRELLGDPRLRERFSRAETLYGDLDRTFPDRRRHGLRVGRRLHRPHEAVRLPSGASLRVLARRHGVAALKLFGSGVRSDFRPDSDVDLLVRYRPSVRPSLRSLIDLEHALEAATGRDVDLIREENLRDDVRERIEREAVSLL
jgi:predicted nucleotidyltransferase/DNA-binding transcriptional ArsR family regulator